MCSTSGREQSGRTCQVVRMMDGAEETGARRAAQELGFQPEVQLMRVGLHLFLDFLLVVIDLPGDVHVHSAPLPGLPQHGPERIRQPGVLL